MREVLFVVGEASAICMRAKSREAVRMTLPAVRMVGVGGGHMRRAGVEIIEDVEQLAVMGFVEVLQHVPKHWALLRRLRARIESGSVGLVVLLDYPGFNLRVAEVAKRAGVPVLYYITPQVWAWGAKRLPTIARS